MFEKAKVGDKVKMEFSPNNYYVKKITRITPKYVEVKPCGLYRKDNGKTQYAGQYINFAIIPICQTCEGTGIGGEGGDGSTRFFCEDCPAGAAKQQEFKEAK